jgi:hypothetical protein
MPRRSRHQQVRPNRRFARKLPAALAGIAIALPGVVGPASARADTQRAAHAGPPPSSATATAAPVRGGTRQPNSAGR